MEEDKEIPTVTAPVLVVESSAYIASNIDNEESLKQKWKIEYQKELQQKIFLPTASRQPYVLMTFGMIVLVVISIVMLETFSPATRDNTSTITNIIGFAATTTAALFAYQKSQDTHVIVNSRLSEWMQKSEESALRKGMDEGRDKANKRADMLADKAAAKSESSHTPVE